MATVQHDRNKAVPVPQFIHLLWVTNLVGGNPADADQVNVIDYLRSLGHTVDVVDDSQGGNLDLYDVVFVHEDVSTGAVLNNLPGLAQTRSGVVVAESFLYDDVFGAPQGNVDPGAVVEVVDNLHPITLQMSLGVFDVGVPLNSYTGAAGRVVVRDGVSGMPKVVVWEVGDALEAGHAPAVAAGRRVAFDFRNDFGATINPIGVLLFVRAALWAGRAI